MHEMHFDMSQSNTQFVEAQSAASGCVVDAPYCDAPLVITFDLFSWNLLNGYDINRRAQIMHKNAEPCFNRILVCDTANLWCQHGVTGLGIDVDSTATSLRNLIARIKPTSISTIGQSMGAYAAILFGALLNVDRVLAFGPLSYLKSEWAKRDGDTRWLRMMEKLDQFPPARLYDDLPALLESLPRQPVVRIVMGTTDEVWTEADQKPIINLDSLHAARFAKVSGVSVQATYGSSQWLIDNENVFKTWITFQQSVTPKSLQSSLAALTSPPLACAGPTLFDDSLRVWIADNLSQGSSAEKLLHILVTQGFNLAQVQRELDKASRSPYLLSAMRLAQQVVNPK